MATRPNSESVWLQTGPVASAGPTVLTDTVLSTSRTAPPANVTVYNFTANPRELSRSLSFLSPKSRRCPSKTRGTLNVLGSGGRCRSAGCPGAPSCSVQGVLTLSAVDLVVVPKRLRSGRSSEYIIHSPSARRLPAGHAPNVLTPAAPVVKVSMRFSVPLKAQFRPATRPGQPTDGFPPREELLPTFATRETSLACFESCLGIGL